MVNGQGSMVNGQWSRVRGWGSKESQFDVSPIPEDQGGEVQG
ncbi:hypothetical protein [Oscillatoria sp. FACHB-1407]|nr:hypothetical protein [Oscillatoria sp. FACHB-1407]